MMNQTHQKLQKMLINLNKDKVDVIIGTVHSGVALGMIQAIKNSNSALIIPNAGANAATKSMCANNVFRTSFLIGSQFILWVK